MSVALYARVSSEKQDVDLSLSAQLKAMREHAIRNGHEVVREYVDEAESGRSIDRPGFKAMIAAARRQPPPFSVILVWKLSQFARNRESFHHLQVAPEETRHPSGLHQRAPGGHAFGQAAGGYHRGERRVLLCQPLPGRGSRDAGERF